MNTYTLLSIAIIAVTVMFVISVISFFVKEFQNFVKKV